MITFDPSDSGFDGYPYVRHHVRPRKARHTPRLLNGELKKGVFHLLDKALRKNLAVRIIYSNNGESVDRFEFYALGRQTGCIHECFTFNSAHTFIQSYNP